MAATTAKTVSSSGNAVATTTSSGLHTSSGLPNRVGIEFEALTSGKVGISVNRECVVTTVAAGTQAVLKGVTLGWVVAEVEYRMKHAVAKQEAARLTKAGKHSLVLGAVDKKGRARVTLPCWTSKDVSQGLQCARESKAPFIVRFRCPENMGVEAGNSAESGAGKGAGIRAKARAGVAEGAEKVEVGAPEQEAGLLELRRQVGAAKVDARGRAANADASRDLLKASAEQQQKHSVSATRGNQIPPVAETTAIATTAEWGNEDQDDGAELLELKQQDEATMFEAGHQGPVESAQDRRKRLFHTSAKAVVKTSKASAAFEESAQDRRKRLFLASSSAALEVSTVKETAAGGWELRGLFPKQDRRALEQAAVMVQKHWRGKHSAVAFRLRRELSMHGREHRSRLDDVQNRHKTAVSKRLAERMRSKTAQRDALLVSHVGKRGASKAAIVSRHGGRAPVVLDSVDHEHASKKQYKVLLSKNAQELLGFTDHERASEIMEHLQVASTETDEETGLVRLCFADKERRDDAIAWVNRNSDRNGTRDSYHERYEAKVQELAEYKARLQEATDTIAELERKHEVLESTLVHWKTAAGHGHDHHQLHWGTHRLGSEHLPLGMMVMHGNSDDGHLDDSYLDDEHACEVEVGGGSGGGSGVGEEGEEIRGGEGGRRRWGRKKFSLRSLVLDSAPIKDHGVHMENGRLALSIRHEQHRNVGHH